MNLCLVVCPPMVVIGGLWSIPLICCIIVPFLGILLYVVYRNSAVLCCVALLTTSVAACCVSSSFAGCLSLSFVFSLRIVVGSFVVHLLANWSFSFALSSVAIAMLSIALSFVAFLSFTLSFLSFAFVLSFSFALVDGSYVHRCSSSIVVCCNTG